MDSINQSLLKEMLKTYSTKNVMLALAKAASDLADNYVDSGMKDNAKELSLLSQSLEDLVSGRPFLV